MKKLQSRLNLAIWKVTTALQHPASGVALLLLVALVGSVAEGRVGGGNQYSGGRSSSSRSSGGHSGSSGGGGDVSGLLVWLLFEHPAIGIPLVIAVIAVSIYRTKQEKAGQWRQGSPPAPVVRTPASAMPRQQLVQWDPGFSETLFIDFAQQVHTTARRRVESGDLAPLQPWMSASALGELQASNPHHVDDVIFGATSLSDARIVGHRVQAEVVFETNLLGHDSHEKPQQWLRQEVWTFGRRTGVHSPGPARMRALVCGACGDPREAGLDGRCPSCGGVRTGGETHWEVETVRVVYSRALPPMELHLGGGVEPGTRRPSVIDPDLGSARRAMVSRHPDFSWTAFEGRVRHVFLGLQQAWSAGTLEKARAWQTDALYQVHRFWMSRYSTNGLKNQLEDVEVSRVEFVKVMRDAWFETITVRIFASIRDWTVRTQTGEIVGGSNTQPRVFSEYWTFIRAIGAPSRNGNVDDCPSCGAPLDNVNAAGICEYCGSKVTGGDFDWVLSRIDQDESYQG